MNITRDLIYPKGAYILHMIRMMMWDGKTGDQNFKATMQDFVKTYARQVPPPPKTSKPWWKNT